MTQITACRSCGSQELFPFLDLGEQPLANALLTREDLARPEPTYPLKVVVCTDCTLVQITENVDPEILFRDYIYFSSFSETMLSHAKEFADRLRADRGLNESSLVVEIASNDGSLLKNFVAAGVPVLGIEPARNIAAHAVSLGIPTVSEFFGTSLADQLAAAGCRADLMVANNVMAHVPDINDIVGGVKRLLKADGLFVMETPYVKDMVERLEFDTMYHEHYYCHSMTGLDHLYRRHGLTAVDVQWLPIHGGTIQLSVTHAGVADPSGRVRAMLADEKRWAADTRFYAGMADRVAALKRQMLALLEKIRAEGKRVAAYGAAAKGATLLNYMRLGPDLIEYVVDRSTHKQGKYMPGSRIPIYPPARLSDDRPDYVVLLAWNLADEIMKQQEQYRRSGGKFIVPVPEVRVA